MRYTKQRKKSFFCGPVVLLNAMKFSGRKVAWRDQKERLKKICKYEPRVGVPPGRLYAAFQGLLAKKIGQITVQPTLPFIDKALKDNKAVILRFLHGNPEERSGHYILIIGKRDRTYSVVNWSHSKAVGQVTRKCMSKHLRLIDNRYPIPYSIAWTVEGKAND